MVLYLYLYFLPLLVHCELSDNEVRATGNPQSYKNYLQSRPKKWEDDAIALMIKLCGEYNCRVHIVHLSSANSIAQIVAAKQRGLPITIETGQHYLYFIAEEIPDRATALKCAPPIREKENNDQLWAALKTGVIDFVATDHSPATPNLKEICLQADIIVAALGKPGFLTADMVKENAVVVDVGITRVADASKKSGFSIKGDVDFENVAPKCSYITPVPGGVGLMTIAALLMNTYNACLQKQ